MGRAYEVRKASIQREGAAKGKLYTTFAKEIYLVAKNNPEVESNLDLKRLIDKAKKSDVPQDIIKRAIDKAKGGTKEDYKENIYEGFGPGASTFIVKTLTDNVNRTVGEVRAAFNKLGKSLGVSGSVSFNYEHLAVIAFKSDKFDEIFEKLVNDGIDLVEFEQNDDLIEISVNAKDEKKLKDSIHEFIKDIELDIDEVGFYAKEKITLNDEDKETYDKLVKMLENIDDVTKIFTNVEE